ncbi:hypothetical protein M413DRAFT_259465 [Hebeloma cylindrosporum]|uniref:Secreted protein n=1 Tax=Hebeloma cylindrosporum TaxID=76867 RepID=A0A0C3CCY1_HEBCY|nr:hypothetical protein M413DRAFT_259465 [Hebeloma cylindrosporum h7]
MRHLAYVLPLLRVTLSAEPSLYTVGDVTSESAQSSIFTISTLGLSKIYCPLVTRIDNNTFCPIMIPLALESKERNLRPLESEMERLTHGLKNPHSHRKFRTHFVRTAKGKHCMRDSTTSSTLPG